MFRKRLLAMFIEPMVRSTKVPMIWIVCDETNTVIRSERLTDTQSIPVENRSIINAELSGIFMPSLQQAADAR
jgi:hypothetical protein